MSETTGDFELGDEDQFDDPLLPPNQSSGDDSPLTRGGILCGRFELVRKFKEREDIKVWLAWDLALPRFVVLKFVRTRLLEEAKRAIAAAGDVIEVYEYNTDIPDNPFLVLEAALGGPLGKLAEVWAENPQLLIEKIIPTIRALGKAHTIANIIHRDLKPDNLLLWIDPPVSRDGKLPSLPDPSTIDPRAYIVKIADWGIATEDGDAESRGGGTPGFAAPEQWGNPATPAADLFGMAATLYILLTGRHVMPPTWEFTKSLHSDPTKYQPPTPVHELNRYVDRRLSRIIMKSLALDPAQRHATADAFAVELKRWLDGFAIDGDGNMRRLGLWLQRNAILVAALVLVVGFAVSGGLSAISDARTREEAEKIRGDNSTIRADNERIRAETAEIQVNLLHAEFQRKQQELIADAISTARRGNWPVALRRFNEAIKNADSTTALGLRVERLFGYFATNDETALVGELNALEEERQLGPLMARLKLIRGAFLMCDQEKVSEGRELIRHALEERKQLPDEKRAEWFPPTDALYGQALLMVGPNPTVEKLKEAVRTDALHFPSHAALVVALIASGDVDAALKQVEVFVGLFPDSQIPAFVRSLAALYIGDRQKMRSELKEFRRQVHKDVNELERYFELLADVLEIMDQYDINPSGLNFLQLGKLLNKVNQLQEIAVAALRPIVFPVPIVNSLLTWNKKTFEALLEGASQQSLKRENLPKVDAVGAQLAAIAKDYPEALIHAILAANRFVGASIALVSDDEKETTRRFQETAALAYQAIKQPTIIPRSSTKYCARFMGVTADIALLKLMPDAGQDHFIRLWMNLPLIIEEGYRWPSQRDECVSMIVRLVISSPPPKLGAQWNLSQPDGAKAYRQRNRELYFLTRTLLDTWVDTLRKREGKDKERVDKKASELRNLLETWGMLQDVKDANEPVPLPMPRRPKMSGHFHSKIIFIENNLPVSGIHLVQCVARQRNRMESVHVAGGICRDRSTVSRNA